VLREGVAMTLERELDQQRVYSVLRPIRASDGTVIGAFEVAQPLATLRAELTRTRQRFLLNTLTLLTAVSIVILALVRRLVGAPLARFVAAARALGRGELAHRITPDRRSVELAELAAEFNRMAGHLETARADLVREADERLALERRLRESEKLAAIGNLAAGLAHEMGAPLHVIRGRTEMLLRRGDLAEPGRRNLRIIDEQTGRITHIVRNLLDFSRRREPRIGRVDIGAVARGAAELLEPEMEKLGVAFRWEGLPSLWVEGDPDLLHQVFVNLYMNALYALQAVEHERVITCAATSAAGMAQIEVRDSGPGIPGDVLPRVFEPFFTTKPGAHGTGLGLAVARSIMEEHGGTLEVASAGDGASRSGAVFQLRLAAAAAREAQRA
jgi:signal transduction histidine kinase